MLLRLLDSGKLPGIPTLTRRLSRVDRQSIRDAQAMNRDLDLDPLAWVWLALSALGLWRPRSARERSFEGSTVQFRTWNKGRRDYYPLSSAVPQKDQILNVHHRPWNACACNDAEQFIRRRLDHVRPGLPAARLEGRLPVPISPTDRSTCSMAQGQLSRSWHFPTPARNCRLWLKCASGGATEWQMVALEKPLFAKWWQ